MTSRSLYRYLLRLHPPYFRERYEEQMLWIFDESVHSRGASALLFDAMVSLLRQWVLRSEYWRHAQPSLAVDGTTAFSEVLHRNAQKRFRRAWWINVLWTASAFVVLLICPISYFLKCQFLFLAVNAFLLFSGKKQFRNRNQEFQYTYTSLFYYKNSREFYRKQIEAKRDGLRAWIGKDSGIGGAGGIYGMLAILTLLVIVRPVIRNYQGLPHAGLDWEHSRYFFWGLSAVAFSFRFMSPFNERAAEAIQQELDAMDDSSKPPA